MSKQSGTKPDGNPAVAGARRLLADVGGTNIRLALSSCGGTDVHAIAKLACAEFESLEAAIDHYLNGLENKSTITEACLAVAGPVNADLISMTNLPWQFSQQALKNRFKLESLRIINDFAAVAYSIPALKPEDCAPIGGDQPQCDAPILAIGPGTGLGMATVIPNGHSYLAFPAEGGHATIAAQTQREREIVAYHIEQNPKDQSGIDQSGIDQSGIDQRNKDYGSTEEALAPCREFFISGRGLAAIYVAIGGSADLQPAEISSRAVAGEDELCIEALEIFCAWLGSTCGDQAVSSGALGGVYIAGGMVKQFLPFLQQSAFRARFEDKGAMRDYLGGIPCYVILRDHVALLGCAAANLKG